MYDVELIVRRSPEGDWTAATRFRRQHRWWALGQPGRWHNTQPMPLPPRATDIGTTASHLTPPPPGV